MLINITAEIVEYHKNDSGFTWNMFGAEKLYKNDHEITNLKDLESIVLSVRDAVKDQYPGKEAMIFISPIGRSKKIRGFDKWKTSNHSLREIRL